MNHRWLSAAAAIAGSSLAPATAMHSGMTVSTRQNRASEPQVLTPPTPVALDKPIPYAEMTRQQRRAYDRALEKKDRSEYRRLYR